MIHPSAVIDPNAELAADVTVGPFTVIGAGVRIAAGTTVGAHVTIEGPTSIGPNNEIHSYAALGTSPQDKKFDGSGLSELVIGEGNTFREFCSVNRGTEHGGGVTRIGNHNWVMAYCHVAHDCQLGDHNVLANATNLAGHVELGSYITLGGYTAVHQFCRIGDYSFTAIAAAIVRDVPPYVIAAGNTARARGLNRVGLRRNGFSEAQILELKRIYRLFFRSSLSSADALAHIDEQFPDRAHAERFTAFVRATRRGVIR